MKALGYFKALALSVMLCVGCGDKGAGPQTGSDHYTVSFNANGGSGVAPSAQTVDAGSAITLPNQGNLTRSGYTFGGWNTESSGTGNNYNAGSPYTPTASITLYARWNASSGGGATFTDTRDGNVYRRVVIGSQVWMGENLNYNASGSVCYNNGADSCAKYGRLYNWSTAMNGASSSSLSPSGVQGACPVGWHIPSDAELTTLIDFVGGASTAGTKLKSTSGWNDYMGKSGNGTDEYGFLALPGGRGYSGGSFSSAGNSGYWWSATEHEANGARFLVMDYNEDVEWNINIKTGLFSVRCVAD
jgi:uncharacterized protein (TIGR02145 family)/uncharacterized repeat protein (TIGR02543 family)